MGKTKIEWATDVWNPITGCDPISPGCARCYAKRFAERFRGVPGHHFEHGFDLQLRPEVLDQPSHWKKPRRIFVCSMADLFHKDVPDEFIAQVFYRMALTPQHSFQVLTKRPERMSDWMAMFAETTFVTSTEITWPLPNVWLGVSIENSRFAYRADILRQTLAAVRFVSAEPLLGPLDLALDGISWLIVGGESGPGARPMHPDWVRSLRDQAATAGVAFLFKQWGEFVHTMPAEDRREPNLFVSDTGHVGTKEQALDLGWSAQGMWRVGKKAAGRELDGRTWDEYPR